MPEQVVDQVVVEQVVVLKINHQKTHHLLQIQTLHSMEMLAVLVALVRVTGVAVVVLAPLDTLMKLQIKLAMVVKEDCLLIL
jgi:hypothetical protein